ncbi:alpha/beta fold hydrolase [Fulvivirga lutimaris]|uniref:alpha/beta fold hydrolase n=1 Tax=Fulvivirga lutimaris TaxID=1819566 RepID=UPI0012BC2281|nr:alpha/beta hydrolase [Fulvivirga lutimaris]MTI41222.1 alpha/beta hydrolase [Fulvivirga lutimaris]
MRQSILLFTTLLLSGLDYSQSAIQIEKHGKGDPILFLPGFTSPGSVWNETIENLPSSYQTHTVSYAGFNGVEPIGTPWYAPIKQQLIDYIKKEKLSNLTIIGHSMGGNLAVELAAELKPEVTGLILVDALPCMRDLMMPNVPASALQYDSPYNNQMLNMSDDKFKEVAFNMAKNMTNTESKIEELANWSVIADRKTYVYGYTDLLKLDLRPTLADIEVKTLILGATFPTADMAKQTFENQYANLNNKTINLAENSRHFIMFDQPEWLYSQINNYLKKNVQ